MLFPVSLIGCVKPRPHGWIIFAIKHLYTYTRDIVRVLMHSVFHFHSLAWLQYQVTRSWIFLKIYSSTILYIHKLCFLHKRSVLISLPGGPGAICEPRSFPFYSHGYDGAVFSSAD